jgi:hypothetical protein
MSYDHPNSGTMADGLKIHFWWLSHPSEKYEIVRWDDYYQYMDK